MPQDAGPDQTDKRQRGRGAGQGVYPDRLFEILPKLALFRGVKPKDFQKILSDFEWLSIPGGWMTGNGRRIPAKQIACFWKFRTGSMHSRFGRGTAISMSTQRRPVLIFWWRRSFGCIWRVCLYGRRIL